ncbi:MAG: glucose-1-phosphate thymidylyltransferase [Bacteroidetes bacterium]|nr:MAG: glucose-1-phosphate thymidylyltransferase [Bacteroidota bacterium]
MNIILFDDDKYTDFLPLVYTRPIGSLRCGIFTINEKWEKVLNAKVSFFTMPYLESKFPQVWAKDNYLINARFLPTGETVQLIKKLGFGDSIWQGEDLLAVRIKDEGNLTREEKNNFYKNLHGKKIELEPKAETIELKSVWDLFIKNDQALRLDFQYLTKDRASESIPKSVNTIGTDIFIEKGAELTFATLNSSTGPIYIGKDTVVMEGATIRGPFALLDHSHVKMGAKIYGATTVGPYSKVGGELNNVVMQGHSNKNHDGFLGNAVLGEWCNLGADTNNSNLKNNYATVKTWSYNKNGFTDTGLQFCGLAMGDHSKTGINTMLNTGTVIGVGCNVFGAGYPRTFIPSFSWGGSGGRMIHKLNKFFETAQVVMERRNIELSKQEKVILSHIFEETEKYRT